MWVPYVWHSIAFYNTNMQRCICQHVYDLPCLNHPLCGCIFHFRMKVLSQSEDKALSNSFTATMWQYTLHAHSNGNKFISKCFIYICRKIEKLTAAYNSISLKLFITLLKTWLVSVYLKMLNHLFELVMGDGMQRIPDVIAFDIACQINSSVVAQCAFASFVISNKLLMKACSVLCCHFTTSSLISRSLTNPGLVEYRINKIHHKRMKVVAMICLVPKSIYFI